MCEAKNFICFPQKEIVKRIYQHEYRAPPSEPVLWLYFWCGDVAGEYWFVEDKPFKVNAIKHWAKLR